MRTLRIRRLCGALAFAAGIWLAGSTPTPAQTSDARLRALVEAEYPWVNAVSDWDRIRALREFSYRHTANPTSVESKAYEAGTDVVWRAVRGEMPLADAYKFFDDARGGQVCGGMALLLMRLYEMYGYAASTLSIGWWPPSPLGSNFAHAQTLAEIRHGGRTFRVVIDPVTNYTYTSLSGEPLDYYDLVWLVGQNMAHRVSSSGPVDGSGTNPPALTVGFDLDEPDPAVALASMSVDPANWTFTDFGDRWAYTSPRTPERMEELAAVPGSWHDQLSAEGRPRETIYLHAYPFAGQFLTAARRILSDLDPLTFDYREGFGSAASGKAINSASAPWDVQFSLANDTCTNGCGVGLYPMPTPQNPAIASLYFQPRGGAVAGRIRFTRPVRSVALDVTYYAGGTVTMTGYGARGEVLGTSQATDRPGSNELALTSPDGTAIHGVVLSGTNGYVALNIKNVRLRRLGPTMRFAHEEGFTGNASIASAANRLNTRFSIANAPCETCGVGVYPAPAAGQGHGSSLYFQPRNGAVDGQITFNHGVSAVSLEVTYFNGGTVTMTAYDENLQVLDEVTGSDSPGANRLAVTASPGHSRAIRYVRLTGAASGAAINITNLQQFSWAP